MYIFKSLSFYEYTFFSYLELYWCSKQERFLECGMNKSFFNLFMYLFIYTR